MKLEHANGGATIEVKNLVRVQLVNRRECLRRQQIENRSARGPFVGIPLGELVFREVVGGPIRLSEVADLSGMRLETKIGDDVVSGGLAVPFERRFFGTSNRKSISVRFDLFVLSQFDSLRRVIQT